MALCLLSNHVSFAATQWEVPLTLAESQPLFSLPGLKERLFRLRDITVNAFAPLRNSVDPQQAERANFANDQFDTEHRLFKPIVYDISNERLTRLLKQRWGLEVRTNLLFQYEFTRYRSPSEGREVGLKLGLHYEFQ